MPVSTRLSLAGAALLALAVCASAGARPIQLTLSPYANSDLRTVEVSVGGHESRFIFDTGAGDTVLTPQETRYAGCTPFGQVTGFRATGGRVTSSRCGPVLAPHAQRQLGISIPEHTTRPLDLDVIGLGCVPIAVASRNLIYDGQLDPAFLRHIVLTLDLAHERAWARFDTPSALASSH